MPSRFNYRPLRDAAGFTLVEMLIVMFIMGFVLIGATLIIRTIIRLPTTYVEQGAIITEARTEMERMSDALRSARLVTGETWLQGAGPCSIAFTSNIDGDDDPEFVSYGLSGGALVRNADGAITTVATNIESTCDGSVDANGEPTDLFTYYSLGGGRALRVDPAVSGFGIIDRVRITLIVDGNGNDPPGPATIVTDVSPRKGSQ